MEIKKLRFELRFGHKKSESLDKQSFHMVEGDGFEPSKQDATDLQSAPFGHSGTPPTIGAGDGTRTRNLLITNQLLCQLSYTSNRKISLRILLTFGKKKMRFFQKNLHLFNFIDILYSLLQPLFCPHRLSHCL